jgi:predicted protein tyrosine phosphatase
LTALFLGPVARWGACGLLFALANGPKRFCRSPAAAIIMRAVQRGPGQEREAIADVMWRSRQSDRFCPNTWMIEIADSMLGRKGRLIEAVASAG